MNKLEKALAEAGYEIVFDNDHTVSWKLGQDLIAIRPLGKVEKQEYRLIFELDGENSLMYETLILSPTQADKVAAFLEAGMEYIQKPGKPREDAASDFPLYWGSNSFVRLADEAREALEGIK